MPTASLRPCSTCSRLPPCECARRRRRQQPTAHAQGYTYRYWQPFRRRFLTALVDAGIVPVCGAALPYGPPPDDSQCHAQGLLTFTSPDGSSLHLDHEPPLEDWERRDPTRVCQEQRIVLLCSSCHAAKTLKETRKSQGVA